MKRAVAIIVLAGMLVGCSEEKKPEYLSAEQYVAKYHSHEEFIPNGLKLKLHDVFGAEGPYRPTGLGLQGNPGRDFTLTVMNDGRETRKTYSPATKQDFFEGIPVVNPQGENAAIVMTTYKPR